MAAGLSVRVLIADDEALVRAGFRVLLDRDPLLRDRDPADTAGLGAALRSMGSALTVVAGRPVHRSADLL